MLVRQALDQITALLEHVQHCLPRLEVVVVVSLEAFAYLLSHRVDLPLRLALIVLVVN